MKHLAIRSIALLLLVLPLAGAATALAQDQGLTGRFTPPTPGQVSELEQKAQQSKAKFDSCVECHSVLGGESEAIVDQFNDSVHKEKGFSCADCHGGDPSTMQFKLAMSPERGFRGVPARKDIPQFCARCHSDPAFMKQYGGLRTDQLDLYKTSMHGIALYQRGDTNVAVCTDCHTTHHIETPQNPKSSVYKKNTPDTCGRCHSNEKLMAQYGIDYTIPEQYKHGEHGKRLLEEDDLGAPVCNDCHGNHGAMPPGVKSIEHVCGQCHLQNEQYYDQSKHATAFAALNLGRCVVCHEQHALEKPSDDFFNPKESSYCGACHEKGTPQYAAIIEMQGDIKQMSDMHVNAQQLVDQTEVTTHLSMHDMIPQVEQINTKLLTGRILQHSLDPKQMKGDLEEAQKQYKQIEEFTKRLLKRASFNRFMVTLLAVLLFAYGIYLLYYKNAVLDRTIPWQYYEGPKEGN